MSSPERPDYEWMARWVASLRAIQKKDFSNYENDVKSLLNNPQWREAVR